MSADAASLPCPICSHTGVFHSVQSLRDRLIHVSTNKILCPVCQEEVFGLDKLTIHLFTHVKLLIAKNGPPKADKMNKKICESKSDKQATAPPKKPKATVAKNRHTSSAANNNPVKYVKIYPKLPVISQNIVLSKDIPKIPPNECAESGESIYVKTETTVVDSNTTCSICGLQFIDTNILRMHRCLIHNIDENSNQHFTRYNCHLCPKHFKMRGSLMVHLRVAHYGFLSGNCDPEVKADGIPGTLNTEKITDDKMVNYERNVNKQWQCDVCRKCFTTKYFLKKHKRLHTGETPYACTQCNKTFTFQQSYHKHLLYHNDEKPHTCTYCGRAFKELSTLHNHQRIHTGEKPFSCETCGKSFRQRVSYLVHRRIHTGVMPYKCTACQKSFRYKVSQRTHKCQAQPPGTVIRQSGDLVEKLKKKHDKCNTTCTTTLDNLQGNLNLNFSQISDANAELVRTGAKLSLEDMESENFTMIAETFDENKAINFPSVSNTEIMNGHVQSIGQGSEIFDPNIDDFIESIPLEDKNVPSPSEILKNLCLTKDEDFIGILDHNEENQNLKICKDFNVFL